MSTEPSCVLFYYVTPSSKTLRPVAWPGSSEFVSGNLDRRGMGAFGHEVGISLWTDYVAGISATGILASAFIEVQFWPSES